ncbi:hypothetical protein BATDEDRAFT_87214 [Batrachochytrium dendrobatidis JAM81]|uniref:Uncharacterized protein n=2 Tax=Batrachochytrium dendrobatidis TaxID=109871 RepID=F4NYE4_BATDJ|nr:uncharacterized protein BATDEDRAFT_87214 [Batrachochytrium dendrobatidis JAM81]EGF81701.1 hypothetical protein BATDEDRAFT_87214 [Batrachochytrium dendrobatidis JAM81]KAJ8328559.1 hypothetical protein O5D80_003145 [Batrachochytrium dendrobatidis]KAK5671207.1 hypothetical protein QVD99_002962 [Batrachochytrium dendrobatidis]OAJ40110.1 hypothetical protein BDEG_23883 [Batrachochytrium dendrobatidis JEL423]|eukprot:XP_006677498.1 hypothetical protein BATDEDRAFT_87214 [Batrachochytrium dendrobatidis JAM81]
METTYIKSTVGDILAQGLCQLALQTPYVPGPSSSYETHIDPITFLANYLIQHDLHKTTTAQIHDRTLQTRQKLNAFKERVESEKTLRKRVDVELKGRMSILTKQIDRKREEEEAKAIASANAKVAAAEALAFAAADLSQENASGRVSTQGLHTEETSENHEDGDVNNTGQGPLGSDGDDDVNGQDSDGAFKDDANTGDQHDDQSESEDAPTDE